MLEYRTNALGSVVAAAAVVALAFAVSFAMPKAAFAEGDGAVDQPQVAFEGDDAAGDSGGSSDDTSSGGAEQQDGAEADLQQGAGEAVSDEGSTGSEDPDDALPSDSSPVGAQPSAPSGEADDALPSDDNSVGALPERPAGEAGTSQAEDADNTVADNAADNNAAADKTADGEDKQDSDDPAKANDITITLVQADGSTTTMKAKQGEPTALPIPAERGGYSFVGWSLSAEGEVAYAADTLTATFDKDTTLYAVWDKAANANEEQAQQAIVAAEITAAAENPWGEYTGGYFNNGDYWYKEYGVAPEGKSLLDSSHCTIHIVGTGATSGFSGSHFFNQDDIEFVVFENSPRIASAYNGSNYGLFEQCDNIREFDFRGVDGTDLTTVQFMVCTMGSLTTVNLNVKEGTFPDGRAVSVERLFKYSRNVTYIDMSEWRMSSTSNVWQEFYDSPSIKTLVLGSGTKIGDLNQAGFGSSNDRTVWRATNVSVENPIVSVGDVLSNDQLMALYSGVSSEGLDNGTGGAVTWVRLIGGFFDDGKSWWYYEPNENNSNTGTLHIVGTVSDAEWAAGVHGSSFTDNRASDTDNALWGPYRSKITSVVFENYPRPTNMNSWFRDMSKLTTLSYSGLDLTALTTFKRMIYNCNALTYVDLTPANGGELPKGNVKAPLEGSRDSGAVGMIQCCSNLTELVWTGWDCRAYCEYPYVGYYSSSLGNEDESNFYDCNRLSKVTFGPYVVIGGAQQFLKPGGKPVWQFSGCTGEIAGDLQVGDIIEGSYFGHTLYQLRGEVADDKVWEKYGNITWQRLTPTKYIILDSTQTSSMGTDSEGNSVRIWQLSPNNWDATGPFTNYGVVQGQNQRFFLPSQFEPEGYLDRRDRFMQGQVSRDGYTLVGWKLDNVLFDCGQELILTDEKIKELFGEGTTVTFTAIWLRSPVVVYHGNGTEIDKVTLGNTTSIDPTQELEAGNRGGSYALASNPFTRYGYSFAGWVVGSSVADERHPILPVGAVIQTNDYLASNDAYKISIYAIWTANTGYRVSYDVNGGKPSAYADKTKDDEGNLLGWRSDDLIPTPAPTWANHSLVGWYVVNADGEFVTDRAGTVSSTNTPTLLATSSSLYRDLTSNDSTVAPLFLKAVWEESPVTLHYVAGTSSRVKVIGSESGFANSADETRYPLQAHYEGATATVNAGYHALYWANSLFPGTHITGASTVNDDGTETYTLSTADINNIIYFSDEWHAATFTLVTAPNVYTIVYEPNGGSVTQTVKPVELDTTETVSLPNATGSFQNVGFIFAGWANAASEAAAQAAGITYAEYNSGVGYRNATAVNGSTVTLYARWAESPSTIVFRADYPQGYLVLYDTDGETELGRWDGSSTDYVQTVGSKTGTLKAPTAVAREGYRFLYWVNDVTQQVVSTDAAWAPTQTGGAWPESAAYRAKFEPRTYFIAFDANGGSGQMNAQTVTYGQTITLKPNAVDATTGLRAINRAGYTFGGWTTAVDGTGTSYSDQASLAVNAGFLALLGDDGRTVTLHAAWVPRQMTLRYNPGAPGVESAVPYTQQVSHETPTTLAANTFRRYGYAFAGWSRTFNGPKAYDNRQEDVTFSLLTDGVDINLYALWTPVAWRVGFVNSNDAYGSLSSTAAIEVLHGTVVGTEPVATPAADHVFMGWQYEMQIDGAGTKKTGLILQGDMASFQVLGATTFTATWAEDNIFVRYDPGAHGAFTANEISYTAWYDIEPGSSFYPSAGNGGYTYNGGLDSNATNAANVGLPMAEAGWKFDHWEWIDAEGVRRSSTGSPFPETITNSYTFVAYFVPAGSAIYFDANGGAEAVEYALDPIVAVTGAFVSLPDDTAATRRGYYFAGWSAASDGPVEYAGGAQLAMPAGDLKLFAQWRPYLFSLRFDTQGGSELDDTLGLNIDSQQLRKSQADAAYYTNIENAADVVTTKPGYAFAGWFASLDDTVPALEVTNATVLGSLISGDPVDGQVVTVYAKWTPVVATIHYLPIMAGDVDGKLPVPASASNAKGTQVQIGTTEAIEAALGEATEHEAVAGPGYVFVHWIDADGTIVGTEAKFTPVKGAYDPDNGDYSIWAENEYYYAVFEVVRYTVSFDANEGSGAIAPMDMAYGQQANLTSNVNGLISRPGYAFMGWATEAAGPVAFADGASVKNLTEEDGANVVLYAVWQLANQQLVFHANYAGNNETQTFWVNAGQRAYLPSDQLWTRSAYRLVGWNAAADGTSRTSYRPGELITVPGIEADGNGDRVMHLYAVWRGIAYTVRFAANSADATGTMADMTMEYGVADGLTPNAFARQGYRFDGWATSAGGSVVYADGALVDKLSATEGDVVHLYAVWSANANRVWFDNGTAAGNTVYGNVAAYDQHVATGGHAAYAGAVTVTPDSGYIHAGWTYLVYADGTDDVIARGTLTNPSELQITGRTVFSARWGLPYSVQYLPGLHGGFAPWTSEQQWAGSVVPAPPASTNGAEGKPRGESAAWEFAGWKDQYGNVYASYDAIRDSLSMTEDGWVFEALWNGVYLTLRFDANGGTWDSSVPDYGAKQVGNTVALPGGDVLAARPGYTFAGWLESATGALTSAYAPGADYEIREGVETLYAAWVPKAYTLYYDVGGAPALAHSIGVGWDSAVATEQPAWNDKIHLFAGWAAEAGAMTPLAGLNVASLLANEGATIGSVWTALGLSDDTQSATLYAVWSIVQAKATYYSDGNGRVQVVGVAEEGSDESVFELFDVDGQPAGAVASSKLGYHFVGWYDGPGDDAALLSSTATFNPVKQGLPPAPDMEFWARFAPNTYTVTFNANDEAAEAASAGMPDQTLAWNQPESLASRGQLIVKPGSSFAGWNTKADGSGTWYADGQLVQNLTYTDGATVALFAQWVAGDYFVDFHGNASNAAGAMERQAFYYGVAQNLSENAFWRNGYNFKGWARTSYATTAEYADEESLSVAVGESGFVLNLYAVWEIADDYILKFEESDAEKGTLSDSLYGDDPAKAFTRTVTYWRTPNVTGIAATAAEGYAFAGWHLVWRTLADNALGFEEHSDNISSHDVDSINDWVIQGYLTVATPIWEKLFKVTYSPGDASQGGFEAWSPGWYFDGAAVPTFDTNMTDTQKSGSFWTWTDGANYSVKAPKSADADTYVFAGWYDNATGRLYTTWDDLGGLKFNGADVELVARWTAATQNIVYRLGGKGDFVDPQFASGVATQEAAVRTTATLFGANAVTSMYYWLAGWATESGGAKVYDLGQTIVMPDGGLNLYAVWHENAVMVKYKVRTGCEDMGRLSGWGLRKAADGTLFQEIGVLSGNVFDANGDIVSTTPLPVHANANPGYVFVSWMSADSSDDAYNKYSTTPFTVGKSNVTGVYEAATYWALFRESDEVPITYNVAIEDSATVAPGTSAADAGWVSLAREYVMPADGVAAGSTAHANSGWEFVGWYRADGSSLTFVSDEATYVPTKPGDTWPRPNGMTFTAVFRTVSTVTYRVEHWLESADGLYAIGVGADYVEALEGAYGARVTGVAKAFAGYTYNDTASAATKSATLSAGADTTLVLYYSRERFTVTYEYAGDKPIGVPVAPAQATYRWGETVALADEPSANGYVFDGWTAVTDGDHAAITVGADGTFAMPQGNVLLRGVWTAPDVTLVFHPNGGEFATEADGVTPVEAVRPKTYAPGSDIVLPTAEHVSWEGRVLVGWSTHADGGIEFTPGQTIYMPSDVPDVQKTFYAIWREKLVAVQIGEEIVRPDGNGGFIREAAEGMIFNVNGGNLILDGDKLSMLVGSVTGRVYGYYNSTQVEAAAPYQAQAEPLAGYVFMRWVDEDENLYSANPLFTLKRGADGLYHDQEYTALFSEADPVRVTFAMATEDGGAVSSATLALDPAVGYQLLSPVTGVATAVAVTGSDEAYEFVGWYRVLPGVGGLYDFSTRELVGTGLSVTPAKGTGGVYEAAAYYAVFHNKMEGQASYQVEHYLQNVDGSTYPTTPDQVQTLWADVNTHALATALSVPGFTLRVGQSLDGGEITATSGDSGIVIALYYDRNVHTVTYSYSSAVPAGAPALPASAQVAYGQDVKLAAEGAVSGYEFVGWTSTQVTISTDALGDEHFTMIDADVVLTGYFEPIAYAVAFATPDGTGTVSGAGAVQVARFGTNVLMNDPSTGAAWVTVAPAAGNAKVQYGWTYTVDDEDGNRIVANAFVVDPATLTVAGNMVFTANWIDGFTVTYLPGDFGAFSQGTGLTVFAGLTPADAIASAAKYNSDADTAGKPLGQAGYAFVAWQWTDPDTGAVLTSDVAPLPAYADASYEFTAVWKPVVAKLTFNVNGGSWAAGADPNTDADGTGQTRDIGGIAPLPGDPADPSVLATRAGYHIVGWSENAGGPAQWTLGEDYAMPASDTTLFLVWAEDTGINIYYIAGEGGTVSVPTEQVSAVSSGAAGSVATPKSGRVFKEWVLVDPTSGAVLHVLDAPAALVPEASWFTPALLTEGMTFKALFEEGPAVTINYAVAVLDVDGSPYTGPETGGYVLIDGETLLPVTGTPTGTTAQANDGYRLLYWVDGDGNIVSGTGTGSAIVTAGSIMPQKNADGAYENATYKAVFQKINEIIIKLDANADDATGVPAGVKVEAGAATDPSMWANVNPARPGYTFAGWAASASATAPDSGLAAGSTSWTAPAAATTLFAVWTANANVTATLNAGDGAFAGGASQSSHTAPEGSLVAVADLPTPTRAGYTFLGWTATAGNTLPDANLGVGDTWTMAAGALHAVWQARTDTAFKIEYYKSTGGSAAVKFDTYDGTGSTGDLIDAVTHAYTTGTLVVPAGYALATSQPDANGSIAGDGTTVLKVYFDAQEHALSVELNGGTLSVASPAGTYVTDAAITLPTAAEIDKAGYSFVKWTLSWTDGNGDDHAADYDPSVAGQGAASMPAYDAVLTAIWKANDDTAYRIDYYKAVNGAVAAEPFATHSDAGTTGHVVDALTHAYTTMLSVPGYKLRTAPQVTGVIAANGSLVLKVYFDAEQHSLTFHGNGGAIGAGVENPAMAFTDEDVALPVGADVTAPAGQHLAGWWTSAAPGDGDVLYMTTFPMGADDTELFAIWADNESVTAELDAGEGAFADHASTAEYSAPAGGPVPVAAMPTPTRAGYTFLGWTATAGNTAPDADLGAADTWTMAAATLHAVWQANTDTAYTIEYYKVVKGAVDATPFDTYDGTGTTGDEVDAIAHAHTTGIAVPAGYALRAGQTVKGDIAGDGSLVLVVYFDAQEHALTVNLDGGVLTVASPAGTYVTDEAIALPTEAQAGKAGYSFVKWTLTWTEGGIVHAVDYDPSVAGQGYALMAPADAELKAIWKADEGTPYTIEYYLVRDGVVATTPFDRFDDAGATDASVDALTHAYTIALAVPAGYTLRTGDADSTGTIKADGSLVLKVYLDAQEHTVSFNANGGAFASGAWTPVTAFAGDPVTLPLAADMTAPVGKHLAGWWTSGTPGETDVLYAATYTVGGADVELFAIWADNDPATVILIAGDGAFADGLNSKAFTAPEGSVVNVADLTEPTCDGYSFLGWTATQGNTTPDNGYGKGQGGTFVMSDRTLYAVWQGLDGIAYKIEYYKSSEGSAPVKFDETPAGTTGRVGDAVDARTHAYTTGTLVVPAGYALAASQPDAQGAIAGDGSLVLKLYYEAEAQTLSVNLDGGAITTSFTFANQSGTAPNLTAGYATGATVTLPNKGDIARDGYELAGWEVEYGTTTLQLAPGGSFSMPAQTANLKALWNSLESDYTVNYVMRYPAGSGVADKTETTLNLTALTGSQVALGADFVQLPFAGFTFWTGSTTSGTVTADGKLVINLYYDADARTVTYHLDAPAGTSPAWSHADPYVEAAWTGKVVTIEGAGTGAPTLAGHSFLGWSQTAGDTQADAAFAPGTKVEIAAADLTLYAVWKAFAVVLEFQGGTDAYIAETPVTGSKASVDTFVGETVALGDTGFTRPGYTFDGWYLSTDTGEPVTLYNGSFDVPVVDADGAVLTLVAAWTPKEYTIVYKTKTNDSAGASIVVKSETVRWGQVDDARLVWTPVLTGHNFNGWSTSTFAVGGKKLTAGKNFAYLAGNDESKTTVTLNGLWAAKSVKVTYMMQGNKVAERTMLWTAKGIDAVDAQSDGYTFNGWKTTSFAVGGKKITATMTVGEMMGNDDSVLTKTLYANMTAKKYTIEYDTAGGMPVSAKKNILWGSTNLVPVDAQRDGYTFAGWYADEAYTTQVTNATHYYNLREDDEVKTITLYAKWEALAAASVGAASVDGGEAVVATADVDGDGTVGAHPVRPAGEAGNGDAATHVADATLLAPATGSAVSTDGDDDVNMAAAVADAAFGGRVLGERPYGTDETASDAAAASERVASTVMRVVTGDADETADAGVVASVVEQVREAIENEA